MKKLLTYIAVVLSIFVYSAASYTAYTALAIGGAEGETGTGTEETAKPKNFLIIPHPDTLPGPSVNTQKESGGLLSWFSTKILPKWAVSLTGFTGMASFLMLVVSGIRYMTLYGSDEGAGKAKKMIIYSIVGLLISIFAYAIVSIIVNIKL